MINMYVFIHIRHIRAAIQPYVSKHKPLNEQWREREREKNVMKMPQFWARNCNLITIHSTLFGVFFLFCFVMFVTNIQVF